MAAPEAEPVIAVMKGSIMRGASNQTQIYGKCELAPWTKHDEEKHPVFGGYGYQPYEIEGVSTEGRGHYYPKISVKPKTRVYIRFAITNKGHKDGWFKYTVRRSDDEYITEHDKEMATGQAEIPAKGTQKFRVEYYAEHGGWVGYTLHTDCEGIDSYAIGEIEVEKDHYDPGYGNDGPGYGNNDVQCKLIPVEEYGVSKGKHKFEHEIHLKHDPWFRVLFNLKNVGHKTAWDVKVKFYASEDEKYDDYDTLLGYSHDDRIKPHEIEDFKVDKAFKADWKGLRYVIAVYQMDCKDHHGHRTDSFVIGKVQSYVHHYPHHLVEEEQHQLVEAHQHIPGYGHENNPGYGNENPGYGHGEDKCKLVAVPEYGVSKSRRSHFGYDLYLKNDPWFYVLFSLKNVGYMTTHDVKVEFYSSEDMKFDEHDQKLGHSHDDRIIVGEVEDFHIEHAFKANWKGERYIIAVYSMDCKDEYGYRTDYKVIGKVKYGYHH